MPSIRVLIADDLPILRAALSSFLATQPDIEVVGQVAAVADVLDLTRHIQPDVLVLDLAKAHSGPTTLLDQLRHECAATRVLVFSANGDRRFVRAVLLAGAAGYLVKSAAETELLHAIRAVYQGRGFVDLAIGADLGRILDGTPTMRQSIKGAGSLSRREQEVLMLIARGLTNQQIADQLFLSVKTVETYQGQVGDKIGLRRRVDLARYAITHGFLNAEPAAADLA